MFSVVRMKKCQNDERPSFDVFDGTKGAQIRHRLMFDEEMVQNVCLKQLETEFQAAFFPWILKLKPQIPHGKKL